MQVNRGLGNKGPGIPALVRPGGAAVDRDLHPQVLGAAQIEVLGLGGAQHPPEHGNFIQPAAQRHPHLEILGAGGDNRPAASLLEADRTSVAVGGEGPGPAVIGEDKVIPGVGAEVGAHRHRAGPAERRRLIQNLQPQGGRAEQAHPVRRAGAAGAADKCAVGHGVGAGGVGPERQRQAGRVETAAVGNCDGLPRDREPKGRPNLPRLGILGAGVGAVVPGNAVDDGARRVVQVPKPGQAMVAILIDEKTRDLAVRQVATEKESLIDTAGPGVCILAIAGDEEVGGRRHRCRHTGGGLGLGTPVHVKGGPAARLDHPADVMPGAVAEPRAPGQRPPAAGARERKHRQPRRRRAQRVVLAAGLIVREDAGNLGRRGRIPAHPGAEGDPADGERGVVAHLHPAAGETAAAIPHQAVCRDAGGPGRGSCLRLNPVVETDVHVPGQADAGGLGRNRPARGAGIQALAVAGHPLAPGQRDPADRLRRREIGGFVDAGDVGQETGPRGRMGQDFLVRQGAVVDGKLVNQAVPVADVGIRVAGPDEQPRGHRAEVGDPAKVQRTAEQLPVEEDPDNLSAPGHGQVMPLAVVAARTERPQARPVNFQKHGAVGALDAEAETLCPREEVPAAHDILVPRGRGQKPALDGEVARAEAGDSRGHVLYAELVVNPIQAGGVAAHPRGHAEARPPLDQQCAGRRRIECPFEVLPGVVEMPAGDQGGRLDLDLSRHTHAIPQLHLIRIPLDGPRL
ncbi:MAG: hypothetical protein BWZ02_02955 [Lentisphaerae bacterium ADurb.BinA184]|nr:MAG: hypothetical protein BWZ02_02955 [Lentisphaerae bacterium ADurb.BinA184]